MIEYRRTVSGEEVAIHLYNDLTEDEEKRLNEEIKQKYFKEEDKKENEWRIRHSYCIRW